MATMRAVLATGQGEPTVLYVGEWEKPVPGPGHLLIKVEATSVNRADLLQRRGLYPPPPGVTSILGLEAAGTVAAVGESVDPNLIGTRVMALLSGGGYANYATVHAAHVLPVPKGLSCQEAAAVPEVWLTAYQLLIKVGGLRSGESVLIHAGGSGVGTAAVQLVKLFGGHSFVTAGSQDKIDKAVSLGAGAGINYKTEDFAERVLELTAGKGVNLILDCVGGSYAEKNIQALALDGRWVLYGLMGGGNISGDLFSKLLRKRGSILASTLRSRSDEYKAELIAGFREACLPHFSSTKLQPIIDTVLTIDRVVEAHTLLEDNQTTGKVVLTW